MSVRYFNLILISLIVLLGLRLSALAQSEEVDHIALAQILVKDGYFQRAERTLEKVTKEEKESNPAIFESLLGMVNLQKQKYQQAIEHFNKSISLGLKEKEIYLYRSEANLQLGFLDKAESDIEKVSVESKKKLPYFLVKAEILWKKFDRTGAWKILNQAKALNLSPTVIAKKKFAYLIEEKLYRSARDMAFSLLSDLNNYQDVLAMASQLRIAKEYQSALEILQILQFQRPEKEMVALEMAQNYLATGETFSAALILEKAAKHNRSLSFEASEMLRQVGKSYRARFLNLETTDPSKKLKQKLALYLEDDDYHSLKFMIPQLRKNHMLEDQEIRYAVAYSLFKTGDFKMSEEYLNSIDKDGLFEKSIELKREITNCQKERWACSETI